MKNSVPRITFIILTTILFLQSCTKEKTYELQFEKLGLFSFADLKTPEYISDCRLVIKSTVDIDTVEYRTKAHELLDIFEYDYKYTNNWNNSNCGILHILNILSCASLNFIFIPPKSIHCRAMSAVLFYFVSLGLVV